MIQKTLKIFILIAMMVTGNAAFAQSDETAAVQAVLTQVFDAMRAGDDATLQKLILADTSLDRIAPDKPVTRGQVSDWIEWVSTLNPGQADEQIFDVKINVEGPLATAWAPFTIAIDGELKSCGVNHFTLVKMDGAWKVAYLIDTHTPEKCIK